LFLRPVDGIYSIDSDPGNIPVATNQILLDLVHDRLAHGTRHAQ